MIIKVKDLINNKSYLKNTKMEKKTIKIKK